MNIYVKLEVRARELEARLLLALTAAERGHHVLVGDLRALLSHRIWLPPGVYHDKSVTPSERKIRYHAHLRAAGFLITSQDEEHGLRDTSYDEFAGRRFSGVSIGQADAIMTWGDHDASTLRRRYPEHAERIVPTGSPRVDLWRQDMAGLYADMDLPGIDRSRPYVLFVSNVIAVKKNPLWEDIRNKRPSYYKGDDDPSEWQRYRDYAAHITYAGEAVRALRLLARQRPDVQFVIRPHPDEGDGVWDALIGPMPNIIVERSGGIGRWLHGAAAVIHNSCTTGFEAAVAGVPLISYQPGGWQSDAPANQLGRAATDVDELSVLVDRALTPEPQDDWHAQGSSDVLTSRFAALDGRRAADRIVDVWDTLGERLVGAPAFRPRRANSLAGAHRRLGTLRRGARRGSPPDSRFATAHKFPPMAASDVSPVVDGLRRATGSFDEVTVRMIGRRLLEVAPAGR